MFILYLLYLQIIIIIEIITALKKYFLSLILLLISFNCTETADEEKLNLIKDQKFPRWLYNSDYSIQQTSGIAFLGTKNDTSYFLLADDIGKIHHLKITNDTIFTFSSVHFGTNAEAYLDTFPRADFEEIIYDKYTGNIYTSIEGSTPKVKSTTGIYQLKFAGNNIFSDSILSIKKIDIKPHDIFLRNVEDNLAYEGATVDQNYFYLGFEGFRESGVYADSTTLLIVNRKNNTIIKTINTKPFGVQTICGLYSDKNYSVYGIDRNGKKVFHLNFDDKLNVSSYGVIKIETNIPNYSSIDYVASLESITIDKKNNLYLVDDPWKKYFVPSPEILSELDSAAVKNFRKFVPVIFKYKL